MEFAFHLRYICARKWPCDQGQTKSWEDLISGIVYQLMQNIAVAAIARPIYIRTKCNLPLVLRLVGQFITFQFSKMPKPFFTAYNSGANVFFVYLNSTFLIILNFKIDHVIR